MKTTFVEKDRTLLLGYAVLFLLLATGIFIVNSTVPLFTDDYCRSSPGSFDLGLMLQKTRAEWFHFSGRSAIIVLLRVVLGMIEHLGPWTFGIVNLLVLLGLTLGIFLLATGALPRTTPRDSLFVLLIVAGLFLLISSFGESYYWKTGSIHYSVVLASSLFLLQPFVRLLEDPDSRLSLRGFIGALLLVPFSAMGIENVSVAVALSMFLALGLRQFQARSLRPAGWLPILLFAIYVIFMTVSIIAPGNQERAAIMVAGGERAEDIFRKIPLFTIAVLVHYLLHFALPALTALSFLSPQQSPPKTVRLFALLAVFLLVTFSLLGQPTIIFHDRTSYASEILLLCLLIHRLYYAAPQSKVSLLLKHTAVPVALSVIMGLALFSDYGFYGQIKRQVDQRSALIGQGETRLPPLDEYQHLLDGRRIVLDITTDPGHWENTCTARAYGATSLVLDMRNRQALESPTPHEQLCRFMKQYRHVQLVRGIFEFGRCPDAG